MMLSLLKFRFVPLMVTALLAGQAAQAENAIYQGECTRASQVQASSTVDKLVYHKQYRAVSLHRFGLDREKECETDTVTHWTLTEVSRSSTAVTFDVIMLDTVVADKPAPCERVKVSNDSLYGSVTFTTKLERLNEICEVFVQADWDMYDAGDPEWSSLFTNHALMLNAGSMVVAGTGPTPGVYNSPIAITGVK